MNERILELFEQSPDNVCISVRKSVGAWAVSRTAIWKHIEELRAEGYAFEAAPRKGYRLISKPAKWQISELMNG